MDQNINVTPNARESEKALLGALLIDPAIMGQVSIKAEEFYLHSHGMIYSALQSLGAAADITTIAELLKQRGQLDEIGGQAYLMKLVHDCPWSNNWEKYETAIIETSRRREVIEAYRQGATAAMNEGTDINQAVADVMTKLVNLSQPRHGTEPIKAHIERLYKSVEDRARDPKQIYGLVTGIEDFDKITHGLQKRETLILAGMPGSGKSILAFQIAAGMAEKGHPGCVYELEMSSEAILRRKASAISNIPVDNMRSGIGMNDKWESFLQAIEKLDRLPMYLTDNTNWDTVQLRADLARKKEKYGIEWFLIDYLDLLKAPGYDKYEKSEYLSQQLHGIAKDLDLAGLVIHSLNKAGYESAGMQNLSGSAKVSYDADQIIMIEADREDSKLVTLSWKKMREGDSRRKMKMMMKPGIPEFYCIAPDPEPTLADYLID